MCAHNYTKFKIPIFFLSVSLSLHFSPSLSLCVFLPLPVKPRACEVSTLSMSHITSPFYTGFLACLNNISHASKTSTTSEGGSRLPVPRKAIFLPVRMQTGEFCQFSFSQRHSPLGILVSGRGLSISQPLADVTEALCLPKLEPRLPKLSCSVYTLTLFFIAPPLRGTLDNFLDFNLNLATDYKKGIIVMF